MARVHREVSSHRDADDVWATIGDFYAIHTWCPWVKATVRDASRPNTRIVTLASDSQATEELLEERPGSLRYRVLDQTGTMLDYEGVLAVAPDPGGHGSIITWDATFQCDPAIEETLVHSVESSFEQGLAALVD
jgi:hypothetical protein